MSQIRHNIFLNCGIIGLGLILGSWIGFYGFYDCLKLSYLPCQGYISYFIAEIKVFW